MRCRTRPSSLVSTATLVFWVWIIFGRDGTEAFSFLIFFISLGFGTDVGDLGSIRDSLFSIVCKLLYMSDIDSLMLNYKINDYGNTHMTEKLPSFWRRTGPFPRWCPPWTSSDYLRLIIRNGHFILLLLNVLFMANRTALVQLLISRNCVQFVRL